MGVQNSVVTPQTPRAYKGQLLNGTLSATVATGATNGTKISSLTATSTDTTAQTITVEIIRSAVTYILLVVQIPIGAGTTNAVPGLNLLQASLIPGLPVDLQGNPYIHLESGDALTVTAGAVTSAKAISFNTVGADY